MSTTLPAELFQLADSLHRRGFNAEEIFSQLREKGAPDNHLQEIIQQIKSLSMAKKRNNGFLCCGIGVFLLVVGCGITLMLYNTGGNIRYVMYGLTTIGVGFTLKGLVDLMGW